MAEEKKQVVLTGAQLMGAFRNEQAKLEAVQQRMQQLQALFSEASIAGEAVEQIKKSEKNEKIIVDLGAGVYAEALLDNTEKFKTAFAGNILLNADSKKTREYLAAQKEMLQKEMGSVSKEYERTIAALNEINALLQRAEMQAQRRTQAQTGQSQ